MATASRLLRCFLLLALCACVLSVEFSLRKRHKVHRSLSAKSKTAVIFNLLPAEAKVHAVPKGPPSFRDKPKPLEKKAPKDGYNRQWPVKTGKIAGYGANDPAGVWEVQITPETLAWVTAKGTKPSGSVHKSKLKSTEPRPPPLVAMVEDDSTATNIVGTGPAWTRVKRPASFDPYDAIGSIGDFCTGTLISTKVVLTAAHCLYDVEKKQWTKLADAWFRAGQNGPNTAGGAATDDDRPYGQVTAHQLWVDGDYFARSEHEPADDWGVIILDSQPVAKDGSTPGYMGIEDGKEGQVRVAGFPGTKGGMREMWYDDCPLTDRWFTTASDHTCDTEPGNSGSPVFKVGSTWGTVWCVHSTGGTGKNYCCEVQDDVYKHILVHKTANA